LPATSEKVRSGIYGMAVIVVGVLLALAADSVWEERGNRIAEQRVLEDLLDEFRENDARLVADMETNRRATSAGAGWAAVMLGKDTVSTDSLAALYVAAHGAARFDPVTGALRSLLDAGELHLIRDADLRRALAGWPDRAEEVRNTSNDVNVTRSGLASVVLRLEPGTELAAGARAAVLLEASRAGGGGFQMAGLRDHVLDIIGRIESALGS
jgi:hypothetical protein